MLLHELKIGAIVMLRSNIDTRNILSSGTRLRVVGIHNYVLEVIGNR